MSKTTINFKEVDFDVEYDHQPAEKAVMYYSDGSGYPGCPESLEVTSITHQGTDFSELMYDYMEEIEELILDEIHDYHERDER